MSWIANLSLFYEPQAMYKFSVAWRHHVESNDVNSSGWNCTPENIHDLLFIINRFKSYESDRKLYKDQAVIKTRRTFPAGVRHNREYWNRLGFEPRFRTIGLIIINRFKSNVQFLIQFTSMDWNSEILIL